MSDLTNLQHELDVINKKVKKCKKQLKQSELAQQLEVLKQERQVLRDSITKLESIERKKQHELDKQVLIDLGFEVRSDYEIILIGRNYKEIYRYAIVHKNVPAFESITINCDTVTINRNVLVLDGNGEGIWYDAISKWQRLSNEEQQKFMR